MRHETQSMDRGGERTAQQASRRHHSAARRRSWRRRASTTLVVASLLMLALAALALPVSSTVKSAAVGTAADERAAFAETGSDGPFRLQPRGSAIALRFERNLGQAGGDAVFLVRAGGRQVRLFRDRLEVSPSGAGGSALALGFVGTSPEARLVGERPLEGVVHYWIGAPDAWRTGVPTYAAVRYAGLYPGVDLVLTADSDGLAMEFSAVPGAEAERILIDLDEGLSLRDAVAAETGPSDPRMLEGTDGEAAPARARALGHPGEPSDAPGSERRAGGFVGIGGRLFEHRIAADLGDSGRAALPGIGRKAEARSFRAMLVVPAPDATIEPGEGLRAALDPAGRLYLAGTVPPLRPGDPADGFVARLTPDGSTVLTTVYFGGTGSDRVSALAIDGEGRAYVAGQTRSADFMSGDAGLGGSSDAFLVALDPGSPAPRIATVIGGGGEDSASAIAIDGAGLAWLAGTTEGHGFPVTIGSAAPNGGADGFVAAVDSRSGSLTYARRLGGSGDDAASSIATDTQGRAHLAGTTRSADFLRTGETPGAPEVRERMPATAPAHEVGRGSEAGTEQSTEQSKEEKAKERAPSPAGTTDADAFIVTLDRRSGEIVRTRRLGGSADDEALSLAAGAAGDLAVAGRTASKDFPLVGSARSALGSAAAAFVARLRAEDGVLIHSTCLDDSGDERADAIAIDTEGRLWIAGTRSAAPQAASSQTASGQVASGQVMEASAMAGFLRVLSPGGAEIVPPLRFGGAGRSTATSIVLGPSSKAIVAGAAIPGSGGHLSKVEPILGGGEGFFTTLSPLSSLTAGCPGTINFDNGGGTGLWQTPANWDTNTLPAPADHVCIAGFSVTSSGTEAVQSVTVDGAGALAISGGQLDLASPSQIDGPLTLSFGTLSGTGDLTVNGMANVSGHAIMRGTGRTKVTGGLTLTGSGMHLDGMRVLEVPSGATVTMSGSGNLFLDGPATVENSGTWNMTGDQFIQGVNNPAIVFTNLPAGVLRKTGGTGTSDIANMTFNNSGGMVEVQSGELGPGAGTHTGAFLVSAGTLNLSSAINFNAGSSVSGAGEVRHGGTTNFNAGSTYAPVGLTRVTGTLSLNTGAAVTLGSLTMTGGTLASTDTIDVTGMANVSGHAIMRGTGRTKVTGGLTLTGSGMHLDGMRVLEVPSGATVTMSGSGNLFLDGPATVENSGTWNMTGDQFIQGVNNPAIVFTNLPAGVLRKTGGTGTSDIANMTFNNSGGMVEVQSGELGPGAGTHTGAFLVSAGTLNLSSAINFNAGSSVSGAGEVRHGGTTNFNAGSTYAPVGLTRVTGGTLSLNTGAAVTLGSLTMTGGTLASTDTIDVTGMANVSGHAIMRGTGRTKVTGGLTLTGSGMHLDGMRVLEVPSGATVTMSGSGNLFLDGPATVENSGTWNMTGDQFIQGVNNPAIVFTNLPAGVLRKTGGTGTSDIVNMTFNNSGGMVEVQSGELGPGAGTHTGAFLVSAGTLNLNSTSTFNAGSSVTGAGTVMTSGTTNFNAGSSYAPNMTRLTTGTLTIATGSPVTLPNLILTGGTLSSPDAITVTGMTDWSGSATMTGAARTRLAGGLNLTGSGGRVNGGRLLEVPSGATVSMSATLTADGAAALENSGTWNITNDSGFGASGAGARTIANLAPGVLRKSGGTGTSSINWDSFSNAGTVEALAGTLQVPAYTQTAGTTRVDGATLSSSSAMSILAGIVSGSGTIAAPSVVSSGELRPGSSPGILGVSGVYVQNGAGRYRAELGGLAPGSGYDQANITGAATLGGELVLDVLGGFTPALGNSFTLMTFASRGGTTFSTFTPAPAPCGLDWNLVYSSTSVAVQVVAGACPDADSDGFANCCHASCFLTGGDTCGDCSDVDPGATHLPLEAGGLLLGPDKMTLSWSSVIPPAGSATVHDVVTGPIDELPVGSGASESCLATVPASTAADTSVPTAGEGRWYLVRGRNSCGAGTYGTRSNGSENVSGACP